MMGITNNNKVAHLIIINLIWIKTFLMEIIMSNNFSVMNKIIKNNNKTRVNNKINKCKEFLVITMINNKNNNNNLSNKATNIIKESKKG